MAINLDLQLNRELHFFILLTTSVTRQKLPNVSITKKLIIVMHFWHFLASIYNRNVLNQLLATLKANVLQIKYLGS